MFVKTSKKDLFRWRFDTSSDNLDCFMRSKNKLSCDNDGGTRAGRVIKKRGRSSKGKPLNFQNEAFFESILANTFSEQFAGTDDIRDLVRKLKLSEDEESSPDDKTRNRGRRAQSGPRKHEEDQQGGLDEFRLFMGDRQSSPSSKEAISSTRVCTEETPERSDIRQRTSTSSFGDSYSNYDYPYFHQDPAYFKYQSTQYPNQQYIQPSIEQYSQSPNHRRRYANPNEPGDYQIYLDNVQQGLTKIEADGRTTLMIRNIPNKYTQDLLLEELNKRFKVKFDFFYLPIDYNNACNVGYAFINFIHAKFIEAFYHQFNGKKWGRFNSEKICSLTYARIQGTGALRNHFKNSHVMQQKDKKLRPLLNEIGEEQRSNLNKIVQGQLEKM